MTQAKPLQFSTLQMFAIATFVALLVGGFVIAQESRSRAAQQRAELLELQLTNERLESELRNARGDAMRATYAEKMLFHVLGDSEQYRDLIDLLQNNGQRKVGISLHPLGKEDNLTYVNFYTLEGNETGTPLCHSFLVHESPFAVLDNISGEQSRIPRNKDQKWICGAGKDGRDRWFVIENDSFNLIEAEATER